MSFVPTAVVELDLACEGLKLKAGSYTLLTADSLVGEVDGASVTAELANGRTVRVYKVGNALKAQVYQPGVMIIVR